MAKTWRVTTDFNVAMANGYFGEEMFKPKILPNAIRHILRIQPFKTLHIFYYGAPDARLRKKFGLPEIEGLK